MTVLPYIVVSLIANVGRLSLERGRALIGRAAVVWLLLLAVGAVMLVAMRPLLLRTTFFSGSSPIVAIESHLRFVPAPEGPTPPVSACSSSLASSRFGAIPSRMMAYSGPIFFHSVGAAFSQVDL